MKKILLLSDINSSHTKKWAVGLAAADFQIGIFSFSAPTFDWFSEKGISAFGVSKKGGDTQVPLSISKSKYVFSLNRLKKIIQEFKPDIVHAHYATSYGLLGSWSGFHPFFISVWGSDVFEFPEKSFLHRALLKYNLDHADKIFSTSQVMAERTKLFTNKRIEIIPFGVNTELFIPLSKIKGEDEIVIGAVKSLEKIYGIDVLIQAFAKCLAEIPNVKLKLIIVGDGTERNNLEMLALVCGVAERIKFVGKVEPSVVQNYYQQFDIFVNISRFESFGVSVLEASACGLPVIVSDVGGLNEVGIRDTTCLIVKPDDVDATFGALKSLILDKGLRERLGKNGRKFVEENYCIEDCLKKMVIAYKFFIG